MEYDLIGGKPGQLIREGAVIGVSELGGMNFTSGNIRHCQAILLPLRTDGGDEVILSLIEHTGLHQGTRGDNPDHLPLDHALGKPGVLHLLTDGNFVSFFDQPGDISFTAVIGYAAHGRTLLLTAVPSGEGQFQFLGRQNGIVIEHLIEVAQTVKEDMILMLLLDAEILLHHRG